MKHLVLLAVLCSGVASAQEGVRVARETTAGSPATRANPTAASFTETSGSVFGTSINLKGTTGLRVSVCVNGGNLAGAGALRAYMLDDRTGLVKRNPSLDLSISVTATSCQGSACPCQQFPDAYTPASRLGGHVLYAPDGVTISAGTGVTVYMEAATGTL